MRVHRLVLALALFATSLSAQISPDLDSGNQRFRRGAVLFAGLNELRDELLRNGQKPKITILACADSRVPPELVFDQTLGSVFVVRIAGNVADTFGMASLKYAVSKKYTDTLVVLGHQACGAVEEAMKSELPADEDLKKLILRIKAAIRGASDLEQAIKMNARKSAMDLEDALKVKVVPAYYDMRTGTVVKLSP